MQVLFQVFNRLVHKYTIVARVVKLKNTFKVSLITMLFASLGLFTPISAEESAQIELNDVEIPALIEIVSRITGKNFVVDPRVKGRVTVITGREVDPDELYELFLSILQVHGFSAVPSGANSNLIKVVPSNQAKQQPVPVISVEEEQKTGKSTRNSDELVTRVIRVEHVPAAMLVPILRPLVPSTGQLQAYGPSNTILISDRAANIERIIKVIKRMDRADDEELEVVPLKYASAKDLAATITTLQQSSVKGAPSKNKISADERTNSLLLSGDKSSRQQVRKIIQKLDTAQPAPEGRTKVVYLRYAKAVEMAAVLTGFSAAQVDTKATGQAAAGTEKADVDIQADESSNSLIITAEPDIQRNLAEVIKRLDIRRAQVLVEAVIAEVSQELSKTLGASLGFSSSEGLLGGAGTVAGVGALLNVLSGADNSLAGVVPPSGGGRLGFVDNIGDNRFGVLIDALSGNSANNILSTPTVLALDNEEASIIVGQNVPFVTGSATTTGGGTTNPFQTIERQDVGITLIITPQINEGDSIRLDVEQEVSSIAASAASATDLITNLRSIKTSAMVEDGQILVLGGLIDDAFTDQVSKTPLLGDLPVVGKFFRSTTTTKSKQNLMVFIHPVIMRDVLAGNEYTRQKYSKLRVNQEESKVTTRGILDEKAAKFPVEIKDNFIKNFTAEDKKAIIIREQKQRELEYNNRIKQHKLEQQRKAAELQARRSAKAPVAKAKATPEQIKAAQQRTKAIQKELPKRLQQAIPKKRKDLSINRAEAK